MAGGPQPQSKIASVFLSQALSPNRQICAGKRAQTRPAPGQGSQILSAVPGPTGLGVAVHVQIFQKSQKSEKSVQIFAEPLLATAT